MLIPALTNDFYASDFFASITMKGHTPVCLRTDDSYYMIDKGLEERRYVYLNKETLFSEFSHNSHSVFTIGEIGFGTGLTFLSALELWKREGLKKKSKSLLFISTEIHPLSPQDLKSVLEHFQDELAPEIQALCERYQLLVPGLNILPFLEHNVFLVILVGPAEETLSKSEFLADHWCCDGFSPAKNPSAWTDEIFQNLSRLSQKNATLASFSSAGRIRKALQNYGWNVDRLPGFSYKAHMTRARFTHSPLSRGEYLSMAHIAGAGIAGLSVAYFRKLLGAPSILWDCRGPKASQAPYIYTTPKVHRAFDTMTQFNIQTHFFSGTLYRDLKTQFGLNIETSHRENFDALNRTHRLFVELLDKGSIWKALVQYEENENHLLYPYAIEGSGLEIITMLRELSQCEVHSLSALDMERITEQPMNVLACSWGAQIWGARYNPSSILRGEIFPRGSLWSPATHERYAFNPIPKEPEGFVGFRSQIPSHLPLIDSSPRYTSLHHGSRGFSSAPWCGLRIALSSLGLLEYKEPNLI